MLVEDGGVLHGHVEARELDHLGIEAAMGERTIADLERERDSRLVLLLKMLRDTEGA